jgi:hypothetical protein
MGYFAPSAACIVLSAAMELSAVVRSLTPASPPLRMTSTVRKEFLLAGFDDVGEDEDNSHASAGILLK